MRLPCVAALLVAGFAAPAAAHWESTRWGMSEQQVMRAMRGQSIRPLPAEQRRTVPSARMQYRLGGVFRSGNLRVNVAFAFDGRTNGLVCVSLQGEESQGAILRARLERAFGAPQERGNDTAEGIQTLGWSRPDEIDLQIAPGRPVTALLCARGV